MRLFAPLIFLSLFLIACSSGGEEAVDAAATERTLVTASSDEAAVDAPAETAAPTTTDETVSSETTATVASVAEDSTTSIVEEVASEIPDFVIGIDEVVRFDTGGTSAVLENGVIRGERNRYTLEAAAGQTMNLTITSLEDNAVLDVYGPNQAEIVVEVTSTSIELPADGVYTIIVGGTRGNASYELTVEIPAS